MNVLVWSQYFWPENFQINEVVRELSRQGISVTVITGKPNYPDGRIFEGYHSMGFETGRFEGVEVIRLPILPRGQGSALGLALNYLSFVVSGYVFAPLILRGRKFDKIFVYAPSPILQALPAIFLAYLKKAPLVLWVQDLWPQALSATKYVENRFLLALVGRVVRFVYRYSDLILIQSEGFRSSILHYSSPEKNVRMFANSARGDVPFARKDSAVTELCARISKQFSLVFTGNIGSAQSCETILYAADLLREHTDIRFFLIGAGSRQQEMRVLSSSLGLENVEIHDRLDSEQMPAVYSSASALVLSLADEPTLNLTVPNKLQHYLAAGKPVIASCNGEAAIVVRNSKSGYTCDAEDSNGLARVILELHGKSAVERAEIGAQGRSYFNEHYAIEKQVATLIDILKSVNC